MRRPDQADRSTLLTFAGAAALVLFPPVGIGIFALRAVLDQDVRFDRSWATYWAGVFVPIGSIALITRHYDAFSSVVAQGFVGLAAALVLRPRRRAAATWGFGFGLGIVALLGAASIATSPFLWSTRADDNVLPRLMERLSYGGETLPGRRAREWTVRPREASVESLTFRTRATVVNEGWNWRKNGPVTVEPLRTNDGTVASKLVFGTEGDPYVQRVFDLGEPVADRTFRVSLEIRSLAGSSADSDGCRGVWLQAWGEGGGSGCEAITPSRTWRSVGFDWTAPRDATSNVVRVILNDFDGEAVAVRNVRLRQRTETGWEALAPLVPAGATVLLEWKEDGEDRDRAYTFDPTLREQTVVLPFPVGMREDVGRFRITIEPPAVTPLVIRDLSFGVVGGAVRPVFDPDRVSLWYGHPNLMAHGVATAGLVAASLVPHPVALLATGAVTAFALFLTGSRAATIAFAVGLSILVLVRLGRRRARWSVLIAVVLGAFGAALVLAPASVLRAFERGPDMIRVDVWRFAVGELLAHPFLGLIGTPMSFAERWREADLASEHVVHAHNLVLDLAVRYGIAGAVSGVWMLGGLFLRGWKRIGIASALLVPVVMMNMVDLTLFSSGVLFPLIFGLNALQNDALTAVGPPEAPSTRASVRRTRDSESGTHDEKEGRKT